MLMLPEILSARLSRNKTLGLERSLKLPLGADFSSNDYLGFAVDSELRRRVSSICQEIPIGSTSSRLLRGHSTIHEEVERELARFCHREDALLFPSGYQANVGLFSSLLREDDIVYSDSLNHASIIDGIKLSGCQKRIYPHCDLAALEDLLKKDYEHRRFKLIVTESLFSMEGDITPLKELCALAEAHGAAVIVDEAHSTGIWNSGLIEKLKLTQQVLATIHTGGKSLGASGAWIACDSSLKNYLLNFSRSQIFSTALSPWIAETLKQSVLFHREVGATRSHLLKEKIARFQKYLGTSAHLTPIFPWMIGNAGQAVTSAKKLQALGLDVRAIRPPTVSEAKSRLRITIKTTNSELELKDLSSALLRLNSEGVSST